MMVDQEAISRAERAEHHIRQVLKEAKEPLSAQEILDRIEHPISNGMNVFGIGSRLARIDDANDVSETKWNAKKWILDDE